MAMLVPVAEKAWLERWTGSGERQIKETHSSTYYVLGYCIVSLLSVGRSQHSLMADHSRWCVRFEHTVCGCLHRVPQGKPKAAWLYVKPLATAESELTASYARIRLVCHTAIS